MVKDYEMMVIIKPGVSSEEAAKENDRVMNYISENGGNLLKTDPMGKRILAYQINKVSEGYYFVNYFNVEPTCIKDFKRLMNINENILRYMIVNAPVPRRKRGRIKVTPAE